MSINTDFKASHDLAETTSYQLKSPPRDLDVKISTLAGHIPTWLNLELGSDQHTLTNKLHDILTAKELAHKDRCSKFMSVLQRAEPVHQQVALYLLMNDSTLRDLFITFLLTHDFPDFSLQQLVNDILVGKHNNNIHFELYGAEESLRIKEIQKNCLTIFGEIFAQIASTWNQLSDGKPNFIRTIPQWVEQTTFWVKALDSFDETTNIPPSQLVEYLVVNYYSTIKDVALYPKHRLLTDEKYLLFHKPLLHLLIHSPKGIHLFRDILNTYGQSKTWDNKFLNQILFVDKKLPCEQDANTEYLKSVFSEEYALTDQCRQFVIKSGACFVPMIERIVKITPPHNLRFEWQRDLEQLFLESSAKDLYESQKDHFTWAFHFSEVPSDAFGILSHYIDFSALLDKLLMTDVLDQFESFLQIFDLVAMDSSLFHKLIMKKRELTIQALKTRTVDLFQTYLLPPLTRKQLTSFAMRYHAINPLFLQKLQKRKGQSFLRLVLRQSETPYFEGSLKIMLSALHSFSHSDQPYILSNLLKDSLETTNMMILKFFDLMEPEDLTAFIGYLWQNELLDQEVYEKLFDVLTRNICFPPYKKFIEAVNSLEQCEDIKAALSISDHSAEEVAIVPIIARVGYANRSECSIQ